MSPRSAIDLLLLAEDASREAWQRGCDLLALPAGSTLRAMLIASVGRLGPRDWRGLTARVMALRSEYGATRHFADWPFEHFWENPIEPRHSRLLEHFFDQDAEHGCGAFLLRSFFDYLADQPGPWPRELSDISACRVQAERSYIDLCIECRQPGAEFAVIIENKVNGAANQDEQLETYLDRVHQRGFPYASIYVVYLPFTQLGQPDESDQRAVEAKGAHYRHFTFQREILGWLERVLHETTMPFWPAGMAAGMRDHLAYYRRLLRYLNHQQTQFKMKAAILQQLRIADEKGVLPEWAEVKALTESAQELENAYESLLRGKLLLEVQRLLAAKNLLPRFFSVRGNTEVISDPFDSRFAGNISLGVPVGSAVLVSIGCQPGCKPSETLWIGYRVTSDESASTAAKPAVLVEARRRFGAKSEESDPSWYAWAYREEFSHASCLKDGYAADLATVLAEMAAALAPSLPPK